LINQYFYFRSYDDLTEEMILYEVITKQQIGEIWPGVKFDEVKVDFGNGTLTFVNNGVMQYIYRITFGIGERIQ